MSQCAFFKEQVKTNNIQNNPYSNATYQEFSIVLRQTVLKEFEKPMID
jgi:hypothetical protein